MKIVKPNAVYLDACHMTPYQFIEKCGRTCYKSEDRITEESNVKFVADLVNRNHWAMLEHAFIYAWIGPALDAWILPILARTHAFRFLHICNGYMTGSMRAIYELLIDPNLSDTEKGVFRDLRIQLQEAYPEVFGVPEDEPALINDWYLMSREEFLDDVPNSPREDADRILKECLPHTILFTVDRGVTHELVRHRPASFAQESTRYANYSKGKFGNEITVVEPWWAEDGYDADVYDTWVSAMEAAEKAYIHMTRDLGKPAQLARAVLPQSVKADIIVTATEKEWEHILNLRLYATTGAPHPDMKRVMGIAEPLLRNASNARLGCHA